MAKGVSPVTTHAPPFPELGRASVLDRKKPVSPSTLLQYPKGMVHGPQVSLADRHQRLYGMLNLVRMREVELQSGHYHQRQYDTVLTQMVCAGAPSPGGGQRCPL